MSAFSVVVPARFASTRLPGKPLAQIAGIPMIAHVAARAAKSGAKEVIVATDDERVLQAAVSRDARAVMTRADHASGSDRVMEVAESCGWPDDHVVVNVQGDEPLIPPAVIDQVAELLRRSQDVGVATLSEPLRDPVDILDENIVKVVVTQSGLALYFSRAPIPYARAGFPASVTDSEGGAFSDHHRFAADDLRVPDGTWIVTTEKDAQRIGDLAFMPQNCWFLKISMEPSEGLRNALAASFRKSGIDI